MKKHLPALIVEDFKNKVHFIRGEFVVIDSDLAKFFETQTSQINRAVKRNKERFPAQFMFQLTEEEHLLCTNGTASHGGRRSTPYVFTEMGCWTLSLILTSQKAKTVGVELLKTFKAMKDYLRNKQDTLPSKMQQVLSSKNATINLYDSPHAIIVVGDGISITQSFSSLEEIVPTLRALLPVLSADHKDIATAIRELVTLSKHKDESKIKDSLGNLSNLVNVAKDGGAAVLAIKSLLAGLGLML